MGHEQSYSTVQQDVHAGFLCDFLDVILIISQRGSVESCFTAVHIYYVVLVFW